MNWVILAIVAPFAFVTFQSISKLIPKELSSLFVTGAALLIGGLLLLISYFVSEKSVSIPEMGGREWLLAVAIGLLLGLGNMLLIRAFALGAPQTELTVIFNALYLVGGVAFGLLFWSEKLSLVQALGAILALSGVFLVAYGKA